MSWNLPTHKDSYYVLLECLLVGAELSYNAKLLFTFCCFLRIVVKYIISSFVWKWQWYRNFHHSWIKSWWTTYNGRTESFPVHWTFNTIPLRSNNANERPGIGSTVLSEAHSSWLCRVVGSWSMRCAHMVKWRTAGWNFNVYSFSGVKGRIFYCWHKIAVLKVRKDWLFMSSRDDLKAAFWRKERWIVFT